LNQRQPKYIANCIFTKKSGPSPVNATVSQLQAQGFQVIVSRVDTATVNQCTVSAVRPGQTFTRTDSGVPGAQGTLSLR
jgi:hypothetical protein